MATHKQQFEQQFGRSSKFHIHMYYILISLFAITLTLFVANNYICPEKPIQETIQVTQGDPYNALEVKQVPLTFTDRAYQFEGYDYGDLTTIVKVFVKNTDSIKGVFKVQITLTNATNTYVQEDEQGIVAGEERLFYFEQREGRDNTEFNFTHSVTPPTKETSAQVTKYNQVAGKQVVTVLKRSCF